MKTSLIISIALFAVFTIPEISCSENTYCADFRDRCMEDDDCCSQNCYYTGNPQTSYCLEAKNTTFNYKVEEGICSYNKSLHKNKTDRAFVLYGYNAAHSILPPFTSVQLNYNNKSIDVTINGFEKNSNETILELSKEAATLLGIETEGTFPCSIQVNEPEPNYSHIKKILGMTSSFFVIVLIILHVL